MAAGTYEPIVPWSPNGFTDGTVELLLKASQTFKKGAPLVSNGGYYEEAATSPSTVAYIAAEDAVSGASDGAETIIAWRVDPGKFYEISCEDAHAVTDYGAVWGLKKDATTGFWIADSADAGDQVVFIRPVVTPKLGVVGDTKYRALFQFQVANIAGAA